MEYCEITGKWRRTAEQGSKHCPRHADARRRGENFDVAAAFVILRRSACVNVDLYNLHQFDRVVPLLSGLTRLASEGEVTGMPVLSFTSCHWAMTMMARVFSCYRSSLPPPLPMRILWLWPGA